MIRRFSWIVICGLALTLGGCKSMESSSKKVLYQSSQSPASELSVITVATALDVKHVNEQKFYTFLERSGDKELRLAPGVNRIVVRFVESYGDEEEGTEILRSGDQPVELDLAKGSRYRLETRTPSDRQAAERYVNGLIELWLVDQQSGERIDLRGPRRKRRAADGRDRRRGGCDGINCHDINRQDSNRQDDGGGQLEW
ncbi:MAG: DUF2057 family protein [Deltaproteobacteria bacterium]|nr:DUF2057 family protein [Deltaproteobacteria bacterium]